MNIGVAKVFQIEAKQLIMVVLVQPRLSIIFISSREGWCGENHTLPYPGYATDVSTYFLKKFSLYVRMEL